MKKTFKRTLSLLLAVVMIAAVFAIAPVSASAAETDPEWTHDGGTITAYNGNASSVVIPSELDGEAITAIGGNVFSGRESLTEVTIPEGIVSIGQSAFNSCGLTSVTFPETLTEIGESAFYGCPMRSVDIPESVTNVGSNAFYYEDYSK